MLKAKGENQHNTGFSVSGFTVTGFAATDFSVPGELQVFSVTSSSIIEFPVNYRFFSDRIFS